MATSTTSIANVYGLLGVPPPNQATLTRIAGEIDAGTRSWTDLRESIVRNEMAKRGVTRERIYLEVIKGYYLSRGATPPPSEQLWNFIGDLNTGNASLSDIRRTALAAPVTNPPAPSPAPSPAPKPPAPPAPKPAPGTDPGTPKPIDWKARVKALYPWLQDNLIGIFADLWADSGDQQLALGQLRAGQKIVNGQVVTDPSKSYENAFKGIKRVDGSLRMTEQEWFSTREAYGSLFQDFGLNSSLFTDRFTELMEGDVSPSELAARLGGAYEQIIGNVEQVRQTYAAWFGAGGMTDAAIFASFIDPDIGDAILNRRISVAQVGGEGLARGLDVNQGFAERLVAGGVDQATARQLFSDAEGRLGTLDTLVRRHRDPDDTFDLEEFADAAVFGDAAQNRRIRRVLKAEASLFSDQFGTVSTSDDLALTGLTLR